MYDGKTLGVLLVVLLLFFGSNSMNAQAFSATWPFTSGTAASVTGDGSSNVSANAASYTTGTLGTVTFASATTTTGFLNGTGLSGRAATSCASSYNSVGSTSPAAPYIEYKIVPNAGYKMTTNSFTFTVEQVTNVTNVVVAAGYSVNGGSSFTGLAAPTTSGSFTAPSANASPTASNYGTSATAPATCAGTFTFTVPAATIAATNSFILRVVVWRNNASNSSSANLKISPPVITGTTEVNVAPVITAPTPGTLSNFNYIAGAGPSISKSFVVAGTNLTADLVVTPATDYEISSDNASFSTTPISLTPTAGTVASTTLYARLAAGKVSGTYMNRYMNITSTDAVTQSVVCSGFVTANYSYVGSGSLADVNNWGDASDGSGNHPLNFTGNYQYFTIKNTSAVATDVPWTVSGTGSRIIVGSPSSPAVALTITSGANIIGGPVDLSSASSGSNILVVANTSFLPANLGTLDASSTLEFQATITSTLATYGNNILVSGGTFSHAPSGGAANVTGNVTVTGGSFVLAGTSASTISGNVTVTGGEFKTNSSTITGNVTVSGTGIFNLNTGGSARTLTLNGNLDVSGTGGIVNSGVTSSNGSVQAFHINLSGTGKTIAYSASGSNLTKTNFYVIGSYALSGDLDYSSAGTTVFAAGQGFFTRQISVLSTGSLSMGAHTLKMGNAILNVTAPGTLTDEAATIVETTCAAYNAHDVLEVNEPIAQAAILPSRTWLGTVKYNYGSGAYGQKIVDGTYNNIVLNNTYGAELSGNATVNGALTFTAGKITTGTNTLAIATSGSISGAGTGWVIGNLKKLTASGASPSYTYAIGDATTYIPLALTFSGNTSAAGGLSASTASGDHALVASSYLNGAKSVNRTWTLTNDSLADFGTYDAAFGYAIGDNDANTAPANYRVGLYSADTWSYLTTSGTITDSAVTVTGISSFGDFAIGEYVSAPAAEPASFCSSANPTIASLSGSTSATAPKWYAAETGGSVLASDLALASGTYYVSQTIDGVESARTSVGVTITSSTTTGSETVSACGTSYTWPLNGQSYSASGNYDYVVGCNTATLTLTLTPNTTTGSESVSACGSSYTWPLNSQSYTASGTYPYVVGCNTATLTLTLTPATNNTTTVSAFNTYTWANNGETYTTSGTKTGTTTNCVTEKLDLTITTTQIPTSPMALCAGKFVADAIGNTSLKFYKDNLAKTTAPLVAATTKLVSGTTYWVTEMIGVVESPRVPVVVNLTALVAPTTIASTEAKLICKYIGTDNLVTFTTAPVTGASSYTWTAPLGAVITNDGATALISFKNVSATAGAIGSVTVDSNNALGCPSGKPKALALTTKAPTAPKTVALTINGVAVKKAGNFVGDASKILTLTVTDPSLTADHYDFTLPEGVSDVTGATSVGGSTTLYTTPYTTTSTVLTFNLGGVQASNTALAFTATSVAGCGSSSKTLSVARAEAGTPKGIVLTDATLADATAIPAVLPIVLKKLDSYTGSLKTRTLTLTATPNTTAGSEATSYKWVLPAAATVVGGTATAVEGQANTYTSTSKVISINLASVGTETAFTFRVFGVNGNGASLASKDLACTSALPKAPAAIYAGTNTSLSGTKFLAYSPSCGTVTISVPAVFGVENNFEVTAGTAGLPTIASHEPGSNVATIDLSALGGSVAAKSTITIRAIAYTATGPIYKDYIIKIGTACSAPTRIAPEAATATEKFSAVAYPNPAAEGFRVKSSNGKSFGVQVYDMLGRSIEQRQMSSDAQIGSNYAKGIYNVIVNQGASVKTLRVIKQ